MKKSIVSLFGFLIVIVFGACNASSEVSEVSITAQPTETTFISPTVTAPFVPTVDPLTPSAIAQFFQTLEANTSTPEPTSTTNYRDCSGNMFFMSRGRWGLCHGLRDPITIISQSNQKWQFSYKEYYGRQVPNPCTRLLSLTDDEKFLYFSLDAECELSEPGFVFSISVFRLNLTNGDVNEILKAFYNFESREGNYYSVSISPTGRRIAYAYPQKSPLMLNVLDLQTGENQSYNLEEKYRYGGRFKWSEDGTKLVFLLERETNNEYFISMVFLDLVKDNSMVTFIYDRDPSWISSKLEVMDNGIKVFPIGETPLFYDIETGILSPINN